MRLYLLAYREEHYNRHEYDEVRAAIVAAESAPAARRVLSEERSDVGRFHLSDSTAKDWLDSKLTSARYIGEARPGTKLGSVLLDIHEG